MKVGDCANVYSETDWLGRSIGEWRTSRLRCDTLIDPRVRRVAVIRIKALKHDKT